MPKLKTNRAAAKRFKATGTGKIKRMKAGKQHILTKKSQKMKRRLRKGTLLDSANMSATKKMLPYI
ncbi:MAG: 50S ribosomal protein L35 [Lachnospiraceae bacterium]|nr:50S ribosomal protein L35 [Lachnospiraceae bacterium]